ncbi:MAG TPA: signal peptidase I [Galbitalea sp.]|jgi:signal peptidase I|nr:signal peptidase I [Galbitalea sp.]
MTDVLDADQVETPEQATRRRRRSVLLFLRDILFILLAAVVISFVIKTFFVRSFYIPSASMENTLMVNDRVIVSLLTPGLTPLQHGDVVVFQDPGGWLTDLPPAAPSSPLDGVLAFLGLAAPTDSNHLIKRVIGLPGDHVQCCNVLGRLTVNGVPLDEPYIHLPSGVTSSDPYTFSVTVPKGDIWVMGDNRNDSEDSAYHETKHDTSPFVPLRDVTGQALLISWPFNRWTFLGNYPVVFSDVPSKSK